LYLTGTPRPKERQAYQYCYSDHRGSYTKTYEQRQHVTNERHCTFITYTRCGRRRKSITHNSSSYFCFLTNPPLKRDKTSKKEAQPFYLQVGPKKDLHIKPRAISSFLLQQQTHAIGLFYCFDRNSLCKTSLAFSGTSSGMGDRALRRRLLWSLSAGCCASRASRACRHLSAGRYLSKTGSVSLCCRC